MKILYYKKKTLVKWIIFLIIIIVAIIFLFPVFASSITPALLHVENGEVLVNDKIVVKDTTIKNGDKIETRNGLATVILYDSIVVNLDERTIVTLEELIKKHPILKQNGGRTWNTFTKLNGVEGYSIVEGNIVASVRATSFEIQKNYILGGDGIVKYSIDLNDYEVEKEEVIQIINGDISQRKATSDEKERILLHKKRTINQLKFLREKEIKDNKYIITLITTIINRKIVEVNAEGHIISEKTLSDEEIYNFLDYIDEGKYSIEEFENYIPLYLRDKGFFRKIIEITRTIQQLQKII